MQAGRRRNLQARVVAIHDALAAPQLAAPEPDQEAYRQVVGALVAALGSLNRQVAALEDQLAARFAAHPDAEIVRSQPGLGAVLGARVLAEFGDDRHRYATAKGRKAFAALTASPGARRCYDAHRARGATHHQAVRALGNRLVGVLHGCLAHRVAYQEQVAWPTAQPAA